MNLSEYQIAAKRTDIGFDKYAETCQRFSSAVIAVLWHGIIGMNSEIGELVSAVKNYDIDFNEKNEVSLIEEIGDIFWYLSRAFEGIGSSIDVCTQRATCTDANDYNDVEHFFEDFTLKLGKVTDLGKKELFYGKILPNYLEMESLLKDVFYSLEDLCSLMGISFNSTLDKNIAKLKARYPEQFTLDLCENRDLENERKVLEGK